MNNFEFTKILRNLCLHFARQDGQDRKQNGKKIKRQKTKRQKYGMNETVMSYFFQTFRLQILS